MFGYGGTVLFYVILFAMVAAFLALRLYAVLGKRTGHEQPLPKPAEERVAAPPVPRGIEAPPEVRESGARNIEAGAETGLRAVIAADPSFDIPQFVEGAKSAYKMILEAFWKGEEERRSAGWSRTRCVRASPRRSPSAGRRAMCSTTA